jgi:NADPH-dependent ferric siderophore reductase
VKRGRPLRRVSEKRAARGQERDRAVQRAYLRDRWTCQAARFVPDIVCVDKLDPHERIPRSAWADGIYDVDNILIVCRAHHRWIDLNPTDAHTFGLHGYAYERTDDGNPDQR